MEWSGTTTEPVLAESLTSYFINGPVLALSALAAIPVILHFLLRHKPKKLLFPALRLLQLRRKTNVRRLRLRHIWLLLLRIFVIVLLVLAIARPTLPSANYTPSFGELLTILAVIALAVAVYYVVLRAWRKQHLPNHVLNYRRSMLRGATGGGLLLLLLLLFVWPYSRRVFAEIDAPLPDVAKNLPVSGVFLFDTSLSMSYQQDNKTRLQRAAEIANGHLDSLPRSSQVAVAATSGHPRILFQTDIVAAKQRIERLKIDPLGRNKLDDLIRTAVTRQKEDREKALKEFESDRFLREIYIFTDLTVSAWDATASKRLREELESLPWVQIYLIDVGVEKPENVALTDITLSEQAVVQSGDLFVDVKLKADGTERTSPTVAVSFVDENGKRIDREKVRLTLEPGMELTHRFSLGNLKGKYLQGEVRIVSPEQNLIEGDDVRYFTISVVPKPNVLIASDNPADSYLWRQALAPRELVAADKTWFDCTSVAATKLAGTDLSKFDAVYLINVGQPTAEVWTALKKYVEGGGGVGITLGLSRHKLSRDSYKSETATAILPAELRAELDFKPPEYLELYDRTDPMFATFVKYGSGDLLTVPVLKCWITEPTKDAKILARFTEPRLHPPALIVRSVGLGRTLMFTTRVNRGTGESWNEIWDAGWPYVELAIRMTNYLTGRSDRAFNFLQGDSVRLYWDRKLNAKPKLLRKPRTQSRIDNPNGGKAGDSRNQNSIAILPTQLDETGNYQIVGDDAGSTTLAAFSYNMSAVQSDLTRLTEERLDEIFGAKRYQVARDTESLNRAVTAGRIGKEVFPLVLFLMLAVFCGELFVANRFYEGEQAAEHQ